MWLIIICSKGKKFLRNTRIEVAATFQRRMFSASEKRAEEIMYGNHQNEPRVKKSDSVLETDHSTSSQEETAKQASVENTTPKTSNDAVKPEPKDIKPEVAEAKSDVVEAKPEAAGEADDDATQFLKLFEDNTGSKVSDLTNSNDAEIPPDGESRVEGENINIYNFNITAVALALNKQLKLMQKYLQTDLLKFNI